MKDKHMVINDPTSDKEVIGVDLYNGEITGDVACTCTASTGGAGNTGPKVIIKTKSNDVVAIEGNGQRPSHLGNGYSEDGIMYTLNATEHHAVAYETPIVLATQQGGAEVCDNLCPTITAAAGMSGNNQPVVCIPINDRATRYGKETGGIGTGNGLGIGEENDPMFTLTANDRHMVSYLASGKDVTGALLASNYEKQDFQTLGSGDYLIVSEIKNPIVMETGFFDSNSKESPPLRARQYKDPPILTYSVENKLNREMDMKNNIEKNENQTVIETNQHYWNGEDVAGTLTANNASGAQRMPDKDNFNCVIEERVVGSLCASDYKFPQQQQIDEGKYVIEQYPNEIHDFVTDNNSDAPHQQDLLQTAYGVSRSLCGSTHGAASHLTKTIIKKDTQYVVRRLTPVECARLQGFPDWWGNIDTKDDFTDEEYEEWKKIRNTYNEINGKPVRDYTKKELLVWYNRLHADSAEYKMWGNGITFPVVLYVMEGIKAALDEKQADNLEENTN